LHEGRHWFQPEKNRHVHASDHSKNEAIKFLRTRPKDRPFSLTVAFYPPKAVGNSHVPGAQWSHKNESASLYVNDTIPKPHGSWETLPWFFHSYEKIGRSRWKERFEGDEKYQISMKNYYRLITEVDAAAEQVFGELKTQGILNETLVIFTTDNGFFHGEHGLAGKWYPYHESIRLPLIIYDPRMPKSKRGTMDDSFTLNIDLAETILGAARIKPPPLMQGRDMADLYLPNRENKSPWRKEFFYEFKLNNGLSFPMATALVRKEFKYINWPQFKYEQLFDLINDPLELNDIVNMTEYKDILEEMRERHNILEKEVV
jgi:arylsulfatase A-like enzyme